MLVEEVSHHEQQLTHQEVASEIPKADSTAGTPGSFVAGTNAATVDHLHSIPNQETEQETSSNSTDGDETVIAGGSKEQQLCSSIKLEDTDMIEEVRHEAILLNFG